MGYIARNLDTNEVFFSKGANKIASKVGCNYSTLTKFFSKYENRGKDKLVRGFIVSKTIDLLNESRGKNIKFHF